MIKRCYFGVDCADRKHCKFYHDAIAEECLCDDLSCTKAHPNRSFGDKNVDASIYIEDCLQKEDLQSILSEGGFEDFKKVFVDQRKTPPIGFLHLSSERLACEVVAYLKERDVAACINYIRSVESNYGQPLTKTYLFKNVECRYFRMGTCRNGKKCIFRHDAEGVGYAQVADLSQTQCLH